MSPESDANAAFNADLSVFYQRWHATERAQGSRGGLVIDFDMAEPRRPAWEPWESREDALEALEALQDRLGSTPGVVNPTWLRQRLEGSETYLRALMGERASYQRVVTRMMGVDPAPLPDDVLAEQRERARAALAAIDIPWSELGRDRVRERYAMGDLRRLIAELREASVRYVARLRARVSGAPDPTWRVESAHEDAYWSNWIDGSVERGVTLKVNTHPRARYDRWSPLVLAAHEIAGHAVHVACMRVGATDGRLDPAALNLTVHSSEAFQMEGLAQAMLEILSDPGELEPEFVALELYRGYARERVNAAQQQVEEGQPIDRVCQALLEDCPLSASLSLRSDLRDRSLSPLHRAYVHVYAPARRLFLRIAALPRPAQDGLLGKLLFGLYTPDQIATMVEAAHATRDPRASGS